MIEKSRVCASTDVGDQESPLAPTTTGIDTLASRSCSWDCLPPLSLGLAFSCRRLLLSGGGASSRDSDLGQPLSHQPMLEVSAQSSGHKLLGWIQEASQMLWNQQLAFSLSVVAVMSTISVHDPICITLPFPSKPGASAVLPPLAPGCRFRSTLARVQYLPC